MERAGSEGGDEFSSCHRSVNKRSICWRRGRAEAWCGGLVSPGSVGPWLRVPGPWWHPWVGFLALGWALGILGVGLGEAL